MSDTLDPQSAYPPNANPPVPEEPAPYVIPVRSSPAAAPRPQAAPPRRSGLGAIFMLFLIVGLAISVGLNIVLLLVKLGDIELGAGGSSQVLQHLHSGKPGAKEKIAIIKLDGVIMDGALGFVQRQIEEAALDEKVKAVVLRISSPGGSITASDDLHRRLIELRDGKVPNQKSTKVLVVSMGAMAASGGYYVAMPAEYLVAETTTITGSIGVYAAFPNIAKLSKEYGFGMEVIKAGDIKDSGSMFKDMSPQERQLWQDMVDNAYSRFLEVVEQGRPNLKGKLTTEVLRKEIVVRDERGQPVLGDNGEPKTVTYVRKLADGGIWTTKQALKFGLIDSEGYMEDAIKKAADIAQKNGSLTGEYKVIMYEKPPTLSSLLLGADVSQAQGRLEPSKLASGAVPRLWFLAPQAELAGILSAIGRP